MKVTLVYFLLISSLNAFGQNRDYGNFDDFKINNVIDLRATEAEIVNSFGPYSTGKQRKEYWEMDDKWVTGRTYSGKGVFWVIDGAMESFEITGTGFSLYYQNHEIKIGDHINTLSTIFPLSYANIVTNNSDNYNYLSIGLKLIENGETHLLDSGVIAIQIDQNTNLITKIFLLN